VSANEASDLFPFLSTLSGCTAEPALRGPDFVSFQSTLIGFAINLSQTIV